MRDKIFRWGPLLGGLVMLIIAIAMVGAQASPARNPTVGTAYGPGSSTEYTGPFVTMKVPTACAFPQADLRYYTTNAPNGTQFLRSGAHGHGGDLVCIYFAVDGPLTATDHHYGKWQVFLANHGMGLVIPQNGIDVSYVNCALPGYHFPYPAGNGQPNDCGESWLPGTDEGATYHYQDNTAGDQGAPMFPPVLP